MEALVHAELSPDGFELGKIAHGALVLELLARTRAARGRFNVTSTLECLSDQRGVKNEASTRRETLRRDDHPEGGSSRLDTLEL